MNAKKEAKELRDAILLTLSTSARFNYTEDRARLYDQVERLEELVPETKEVKTPGWEIIKLPPGKMVGYE